MTTELKNNSLQKADAIPDGWEVSTLGKVLPLVYGKSLTKAKRDPTGSYSVFGSSGAIGRHSEAKTYGPSLIVGRKGSVGKVYYSEEPCWPIDTVYFAESQDGLSLKYMEYFLKGLRLEQLDKSTAVPGLSRDDYNAVEVAMAPSDQQIRIVAEIEKQFSRLDQAVASLKRVKANLKRYKAAVLKAAVEGKLTEEWRKHNPDVEPASKLLDRILAERRKKWEAAELAKMKAKGREPKDDKWKDRYKNPEPLFIDETCSVPETWEWTNLGHLSWSVKDGPHYSPKYSETGIPFISGGNIRPDGIDFSSAKFITPELHEDLALRCKPELGDILYTKGGTTGIARVNTEARDFNVWVHVAVLRLVKSIECFYLQHALNSNHCYKQSQKYTHGVGNQDLGLTRMVKITIPLPPLEEQNQIIVEIDEKLTVASKLGNELDTALARAELLRQSTFDAFFSGMVF